MMPPAPARFSTTTGLPQRSPSFWPIARANTSVAPPGVWGTTSLTGRSGHGCAVQGDAKPISAATTATPDHTRVMILLRGARANVDRAGDRGRQIRPLLQQLALHRLGIERARLDALVDSQ